MDEIPVSDLVSRSAIDEYAPNGGSVRIWFVGKGCGEITISVQDKSTPANDCFDDIRCIAKMYVPHMRENAASANVDNQMFGLSRVSKV